MTVFAQGYSSHEDRKLKMETDAIAGMERGNATLRYILKLSNPSILAASIRSKGMSSMNPFIMNVENGITQAT